MPVRTRNPAGAKAGRLTLARSVAAIDPVASMQAIDNPALSQAAEAVREKLKSAIEHL